MGKFEETYILPRIRNKIMMYVRYIDDIFFIWTGTEEDLLKFFAEINLVHQTIKFDHKYSKTDVEFLDCNFFERNLERVVVLFSKKCLID